MKRLEIAETPCLWTQDLAEFFAEETENSLMEDETLRTFYRLSAYQRKALLLFLKTLQDE